MLLMRNVQNILVTGGSGFIGSAFIRRLLQKSDFSGICVNLDLLTYAGNPENLTPIEQDPHYLFIHGDIRNQTLIEHLLAEHAIDTVIHLAAESHVDRSILGPKAFLETNVMGTFHLLEAIRKFPHIHFHHVSTDEVYGSLGETGVFTEETRYQPNSPYSASKASSDMLVRAYSHTYNLSTCISNCSNNYGPYQFPEKLIPVIILNCLEEKPLPVYGKGLNVRDWLYVEDHADALWLLLNRGKSGEIYNIGGQAEWRNIDLIHEILNIFCSLTNREVEEYRKLITFIKDRPGHDLRYAIDCSKMKQEFDWSPSHRFKDGIKKTVEWYLAHPEWIENVKSGSYRNWVELNYSNRT